MLLGLLIVRVIQSPVLSYVTLSRPNDGMHNTLSLNTSLIFVVYILTDGCIQLL